MDPLPNLMDACGIELLYKGLGLVIGVGGVGIHKDCRFRKVFVRELGRQPFAYGRFGG